MKALMILEIIAISILTSILSSQSSPALKFSTVIVTAGLKEDSQHVIQYGSESRASYTTSVDTFPSLVWEKKPEYPATALKEKAEGLVETKLYLDKEGAVTKVEIMQSSGRRDLDNAALEAAKQYRFKPARLNGVPVNSTVTVPFQFRIASTLSTVGHRFEREILPPIIIKETDNEEEESLSEPKDRKRDEGPRYMKIIHPRYPEVARMQHAKAQVSVSITIDDKGNVTAVNTQFQDRDDLKQAALAAAARCKFYPALRNGMPAESSTFIDFLFGRDKVMTESEWLESKKTKIALPQRRSEVNPEKGGVSIAFKNEVNSTDTLVIYNLANNKVRSMYLGQVQAGPKEIVWDGLDDDGKVVENGVYIYIVIAIPNDGSKQLKYFGKVHLRR